ncbi:hypothetical protein Tco_1317936 [Tanacetum coccineum]
MNENKPDVVLGRKGKKGVGDEIVIGKDLNKENGNANGEPNEELNEKPVIGSQDLNTIATEIDSNGNEVVVFDKMLVAEGSSEFTSIRRIRGIRYGILSFIEEEEEEEEEVDVDEEVEDENQRIRRSRRRSRRRSQPHQTELLLFW